MEAIRGKMSLDLDFDILTERLTGYNRISLDLGTGDGRYVHYLAKKHPDWFSIGIDSCRENLREHSQAKLQNALFIIASAQQLPQEISGLASHVTINFPWGSLLDSLLLGDPMLMNGLASISRSNASIELRLNGGALAEAGTDLETGTRQIFENLSAAGWRVQAPTLMDARALRGFPTTWAKRLAFGRDPRAIQLTARRVA